MADSNAKVPPPGRATYADLEAVPANKVAELIGGTLYTFPRPASPHATAATMLTGELAGPFGRGRGGPGGWHILIEPELHFTDPTEPGAIDALVPNLAGWRRERMPRMLRVAAFTLAPDWICEVLSPSTEEHDRTVKMPIYARESVRHAWLIDPIAKTLEVYTLDGRGRWSEPVLHQVLPISPERGELTSRCDHPRARKPATSRREHQRPRQPGTSRRDHRGPRQPATSHGSGRREHFPSHRSLTSPTDNRAITADCTPR